MEGSKSDIAKSAISGLCEFALLKSSACGPSIVSFVPFFTTCVSITISEETVIRKPRHLTYTNLQLSLLASCSSFHCETSA